MYLLKKIIPFTIIYCTCTLQAKLLNFMAAKGCDFIRFLQVTFTMFKT